MQIDEYVTTLLEQVGSKKAKEDIEREIRQHIEEQAESYRKCGMEERDALEASVRDMGDPVETGVELNRIHRPEMPWQMAGLIILIGFVCFGIKILFLNGVLAQGISIEGEVVITQEIIIMLLGCVVMFSVCMADYSIIGKYSRQILLVLLLVVLIVNKNAERAYIIDNIYCLHVSDIYWNIYGITIEPIYLLMFAVPLFGGILYCYRQGERKAVLKCIVWMLLPCFVTHYIYSQISRVFFLFLTEVITLIIALHKGWFQVDAKKWMISLISGVIGITTVIVGVVYHLGGYRRMMLLAWFCPENYENGYVIDLVRKIVQGSGFAGNSDMLDELFVIPSAKRDYMLTFIMAEWGIAVMVIVLVLFMLLYVMLYRGVWKQKNQLGRLMGMACCIVLSVDFIFYVFSNMGIFYRTYTACPFLSMRCLSCNLLNYFMLGILLSIYRYQNVLPAHGPIAYSVKEPN